MYANIYYNYNQNKIYLWEYKDGKRSLITEDYQAYCYVYDEAGSYKDLLGRKARRKEFKDWYSQREFVKNYATLEGDISPDSRYLIDRYHAVDLISKIPKLHTHIIDIEVSMEAGLPDPKNERSEITLITVYSTKEMKYTTFCTKPYTGVLKSEFVVCQDERDLLQKYLRLHRSDYPDILTGWNVEGFDIPYILRRVDFLFGENVVKKYSPVGDVRFTTFNSGDVQCDIGGITILDYMALYKKYSLNESESYSLDYISHKELHKTKIKYKGTLDELRKTDYNRFIEYNIQDVLLVKKIHEKLDFIGLWQVQAYFSRVALHKVGSAIRKFDNYMISLLKPQKIVLPTAIKKERADIVGAYVHEVKTGYYPWIVSYDFTSLYPHIMFSVNISPETYVGKITNNVGVEFTDIDVTKMEDDEYRLNGQIFEGHVLVNKIHEEKLILSANGLLFRPEFGAIPKAVKGIFDKRKEFKDIKLKEEKLYEETKDQKHKDNAEKYDLFQNAVKILANSAYGILANENFRFYNTDWASAVTLTGQKIIKYTIDKINQYFKDNFGAKEDVVIAADTDSVYIDFSSFVNRYNIKKEKFSDAVNLAYQKALKPFFDKIFLEFSRDMMNNPKNWFNLKQEATAIGGIFVQKKKYALYNIANEGVNYDKPKLKVKGMEIVRSSTPSFCRDKIEKVVEEMFIDLNKERIRGILKEIHEEFKKQPLSTIAFPRGMSGYNEYIKNGELQPGTPIHVRASFNYNKLIKQYGLESKYNLITAGTKIKFIYMNKSPKYDENIIAFIDEFPEEFGLMEEIDFETQFEKSFMSPIQGLADAVKWGSIDLNVSSLDFLFE